MIVKIHVPRELDEAPHQLGAASGCGVLRYECVPKHIGYLNSWGSDVGWAYLEHYLVETLRNVHTGGSVVLCPDYQRGRVWTECQQRAWIQFRLSGGVGGETVFFNEYPSGVIELVDGLQRITAVRRFVAGELAVYRGVGDRSEGWLVHEMDRKIFRMPQTILRVVVNSLRTRRQVLRWYLELNGGGTPHTPSELDRVRGLLAREVAGLQPGEDPVDVDI